MQPIRHEDSPPRPGLPSGRASTDVPGRPLQSRSRRLGRAVYVLAVVLASLGTGCVFITGDLDPFSRRPKPLEEHVVAGEGRAKILLVDVARVISADPEEGALGLSRRESMVARIDAELERAEKDDNVHGVILRVNSPGGTVTASDIIYERLTRFKAKRSVPVVAQLMDVAASGGYYVALAADEIIAHPTTVTGSIGVVFQGISLEGLLDKIGVRNQTVKTGDKKDIGSPLRTMTVEERALIRSILDDMQARFLGLVRQHRSALSADGEVRIADGRVLSATQALEEGLIDRIGYLDDAIERTKALAHLPEARVVIYRRPEEFAEGVYARAALSAAPQINFINVNFDHLLRTPQFWYLWVPQ